MVTSAARTRSQPTAVSPCSSAENSSASSAGLPMGGGINAARGTSARTAPDRAAVCADSSAGSAGSGEQGRSRATAEVESDPAASRIAERVAGSSRGARRPIAASA